MTEKEKLEQDLRLYGVCFEKGGKRIDPKTVKTKLEENSLLNYCRIWQLVSQCHRARMKKHFIQSDQIRDELRGQGIEVTPDGWELLRWRAIAVSSVFGDFKL